MPLSRVLRLTVAIGLTAYIIWRAHPAAVLRATGGADVRWLAGAVLLVLIDRALNAWRWIKLLAALSPGSRPPFPVVLRIFFVSTFVGSFIPAVGGDVYRAYSLSRYDVRLAESAASVIMDRVLGVLSMVLLSAAALAAAPDVPRDSWAGASLAVAAAGCVTAAAIVFSSRVAEMVNRMAGQLPSPRLHRIASSLTDAVRRYASHHGELTRVLAASVGVQALRVLQAFCLGRAIGIEQPIGVFFVFIPIAVLMMQLPITVSGLGVAQGAFVWLFGRAGVPAAEATALSLLFIALGVLGNLPGAVLYVGGERLQR